MNKIPSFTINHNKLLRGIYVSRKDEVGGEVITTFDIRMKVPNQEPCLHNGAIHTIEHLVATYVRNSPQKDEVIYFGPMGCRTGFYFLVRHIPPQQVIALVQQALAFIADYTGEIPGTTPAECGNYKEHDLETAKKDAAAMKKVLEQWQENQLDYAAMAR